VDEYFTEGRLLNRCGECHSGDFFHRSILKDQTLSDDYLAGVEPANMQAVECAICHDPHAQTGNAPEPEDGRDFQLRYPEVANPTPSSSVADATNPDRFNLCGQCHHSRGRTWEATTRGPHHSIQANIYASEMPVPEGTDALVLSRTSVHSFTTEQCATCHLYRQDFQTELAPAISGHTFEVNHKSCDSVGCHPSQEQATTAQSVLQSEVDARLQSIADRLGDPSTWEYSAEGGPEDQSAVSEEVKKIRFLYHYVLSDGSLGIHNPDYIREILTTAENLLDNAGM
jgi:formate-dependent nitrite reductase cytochrome c552 subunit